MKTVPKSLAKSLCALSLIAPLMAATPGFARGLTVTTDNGGTIEKQHTCLQGNQVVVCEQTTTGTNAEGQSVSRGVTRTNNGGSTDVSVTGTGPDGTTKTKERGLIVSR
ncbi:hypothetical protein [Celeribacter neptunius]|uniref:Curlin associated repeat-containing protein n=1 Tax=Celeribacter neptunius TaxID=588602 RepID=A0A1I3WI59_9RHOB|nr:hypothetical protein [Celeribacter neptunius]SFK06889.1 hypothetical protein SAMN04487991_3752 [Celeribacter neptunius]